MYQVEFYQVSEVRMGSPYHTAQIRVTGGYWPDLLKSKIGSFQDKAIISSDGYTLFLVLWDSDRGDPGFRVLKVSDKEKKVYTSAKINGCCKNLELTSDGLKLTIFRHPLNKVENLKEFPRLMFDGEVEFKERTAEDVLGQWATFDSIPEFTVWLVSLHVLIKEGLLAETKGSISTDLLENHFDELLKSHLDEIVYFKSNPHGTEYQLTLKNNKAGFFAGWART